jgi:hypothetical protein
MGSTKLYSEGWERAFGGKSAKRSGGIATKAKSARKTKRKSAR